MLPHQPVDPIAPPGAAGPTDYGSSASKWAPPFERVRVWQGARAAEALRRIEGSGRYLAGMRLPAALMCHSRTLM